MFFGKETSLRNETRFLWYNQPYFQVYQRPDQVFRLIIIHKTSLLAANEYVQTKFERSRFTAQTFLLIVS